MVTILEILIRLRYWRFIGPFCGILNNISYKVISKVEVKIVSQTVEIAKKSNVNKITIL